MFEKELKNPLNKIYLVYGINSLGRYWCVFFGGACGIIVIVVGNGHGDTSSNPGRDWLHFT